MWNYYIYIKFKLSKQKTQSWLYFFFILKYHWHNVFMNYVGPLLLNTFIDIIYWYILIFINHLTKMRHLIPIILMKIEEITECFYIHVWKHHDLPESLMSDKNIQFTSDIWQHLYQMLKINIKLFITYYSEMNEQIERVNIVMKHYFQVFINYMQNDWAKWLSDAEFSVNNTFFSITLASLFLANSEQNFHLGFKLSESLPAELTAQARIKLLNVKEFIKKMKELTKHLQNKMLIV